MVYKAVIFDVDGTLVHTMPEYRYEVVGKALTELGSDSTKQGIDRFWFEGDRDAVIKKDFKLSPQTFWPVYRKHDSPDVRKKFVKPYDDIGFLAELRRKNIKIGILTGAPPHIASINLEILGEENFNAIVIAFGANGIVPKPHPCGLKECLKLLKVNRKEAIYVGNADEDIATAKNAKVFDVLISRGEYDTSLTPSLTISSLFDLRHLVKI